MLAKALCGGDGTAEEGFLWGNKERAGDKFSKDLL
jgi:hypothetical protein